MSVIFLIVQISYLLNYTTTSRHLNKFFKMSLIQREENYFIKLDETIEIDKHWRSFQYGHNFTFEKNQILVSLKVENEELEKIESACLLTTGEIFIIRFEEEKFCL